MPIRVLHLIGNLQLGGAQVCVKQLVENNTDPDIVSYVYPLRSKKIEIPIKGNVICKPYFNYDIRKFFAILKICKEYKIDIIHAHLHKAVMGALLATYFCNVEVIVHEHGPVYRKGIQYCFYRRMLRLLRRRAAAVIANSEATAEVLMRECSIEKSNIRIIYNAVDLDTFVPDPALRITVRERFGFSDDDIVIGFIGRLHPVKGVDLLVEAMGQLVQKNPRFKMLAAGDGPLRDALQQQAAAGGTASHICFAGFQDNIAEVMNAFDIGCMPSRQEPFGMAALEMMSMGIPLVASTADGLAELIRNGENALALKAITPDEIVSQILTLSSNKERQSQLCQNALSFCQQFGTTSFINQVNKLYREIK